MTAAGTAGAPHSRTGRSLATALLLALGVGGVATYVVSAVLLFGSFPVPWPDEYLLAEPAIRLVRDGRLGSTLLADAYAGADQRTYWQPPVYFLVLAGVFGAAEPSLSAMRGLSLASGIAVLVCTYLIGRRLGLARAGALAATGLLGLDVVFLRASLVGRMDALALAVTTTVALLVVRDGQSRTRDLVVGALASTAALVHPVGATAVLLALARPLLGIRWDPRATAAGLAVPLLAWGVYIAQDVGGFLAQIERQVERKVERGLVPQYAVNVITDQYGAQPWTFVVLWAWLLGGVALVLAFRRRREVGIPLVAFAAGLAAALWLIEIWYPVYVLPFAYLGIAFAAQLAAQRSRALPRVAVALVIAATVLANADQLALIARAMERAERHAYAAWGEDVARALPTGSRVLLAAIPSPAWGLARRGDLRLRALQEETGQLDYYAHAIRDFDYVLLGIQAEPRVAALVTANADLVTVVRRGDPDAGVARCRGAWTPCRALEVGVYQIRRGVGP